MSKPHRAVRFGLLLGIAFLGRTSVARAAPKVGDPVEAVDINLKWVNATVVKVDGDKLFVHFEGKTDYWNDWVTPDKYRVPGAANAAPAQPVGERVEALDFNTHWVSATVLKTEGGKRFVHFDGKTDYWDQWETANRIRPIGTANAQALQHLAPAQPGTKGVSGWIAGTRTDSRDMYECTFYFFQPDGHVFVSDHMPDGWAERSFDDLQKADAAHCGTYGIDGQQMTLQLNGADAAQTLGFGDSVIGDGLRQPIVAYQAGQRLEGGFTIDSTSDAGGVSTAASDSWTFHRDGTFQRTQVAGAMTDDKGNGAHAGQATANGSAVTAGHYDFANGHLQVTDAAGKTQSLNVFAVGPAQNPNLIGIDGVQYKANTANKP